MTANAYEALRRLLPGKPLLWATVISAGGGSAVVQLPGGETQRVRGDAGVGDAVFVRGDVIESPAPALPLVIGEI